MRNNLNADADGPIAVDTDKVLLPDGSVITVGELLEVHAIAEQRRELDEKRRELDEKRRELDREREQMLLALFLMLSGRDNTRKRPALLDTPIAREARDENLGAELSQKLELLCQHHGFPLVADDAQAHWKALALALAMEHEPGFRRQGRGRPSNVQEALMLILDVEKVMAERGNKNVSEAVHILTTSTRFAMRWKNKNKRTLQNLYSEKIKDDQTMKVMESCRRTAREHRWDLWEEFDKQFTTAFRHGK